MLRDSYVGTLKPFLKRLRATPAINAPLTSLVRWGLGKVGQELPRGIQFLYRAGDFDLDLPLGGSVRIHASGDDTVTSGLFWWGWRSHEPETLRLFQALCRRAVTVIDVGAHIGLFTLVAAASVKAGGTVYAFEPLPNCFERLRENLALNGFDNTQIFAAAVGSEMSTKDFYFINGIATPMMGGLATMFADDQNMSAMKVPVLTLDETIGDRRVDLVKLDTETTEADVLAGMRTILARDRPTIITEVWDQQRGEALTAILKPLGYRFFALEQSGPVPTEIVRGGSPSMNCLATTQSSGDVIDIARSADAASKSLR
jgi:FkbM family methyltransferase